MHRPLVLLLTLLGLLAPDLAPAQRRAYLAQTRQDLDGDGKRDQIRLLESGSLAIRIGASRNAIDLEGGRFRSGSIDVIDGKRFGLRRLVIVRARRTKKPGAPGTAAVLAIPGKRRGYQKLWTGSIGAQGSDGEWSRRLAVTRLGLELYDQRPELTVCAGDYPLRLYGRAFDFKSKTFRPYRIKRPIPAGAVDLTTTTTAPSGAPAQPNSVFVRATGATSRRGVTSAAGLAAPRAVDDGDPATAWIEGRGGTGVGEQILFRQSKPAEKIAALAILPGHGASAEEFAKRGRVASFGLILSTDAGSKSYRIKIPRDPKRLGADAHRTFHWVVLPEPIAADCAQLVLLSSYRGGGARGRRDDIAIAEVHLLSESELGGDLDAALARRVAGGGPRSGSAARALRGRGASGARALLAELEKAKDAAARQRLFAALLPIRDPAVAPALAQAAISPGTPAQSRDLFVTRLSGMDEAGARALADLLSNDQAPRAVRLEAVSALLRNRADDVVFELALDLLGKGSRAQRRALALGMGKRFSADRLLEASGRDSRSPGAEADLWRALGLAAENQQDTAQTASSRALASRLERVQDYERRYRIVQALAALRTGSAALRAWWKGAGGQDPNTVALRRVVVRAARNNQEASWVREQALLDSDPGVRMIAAETIGKADLDRAEQSLIRLLSSDPWPEVRIGAAGGLAQACARSARTRALVAAAKEDKAVSVQQRAMKGLIDCAPGAAVPTLFAVAGDAKQAVQARIFAVSQLGVYGKASEVPGLLEVLDRSRRRAFDSEAEQQVAAATITALGRIGDRRAVRPLLASSQDEAYPQIQAAAAAALASFCSPEVTRRLETLAASTQRTVSIAARRSLASCKR